jgi:hypothetical protein
MLTAAIAASKISFDTVAIISFSAVARRGRIAANIATARRIAANIAKRPEMLRQNTNPANRTRTTG